MADLTRRNFESAVLKAQARFMEWRKNYDQMFNKHEYEDALKQVLGAMDQHQLNSMLSRNPEMRQALDEIFGGENYAR